MVSGPGQPLDTTVYIDVLQGRPPQAVKDLLLARDVNHSSVALAELVHLFGRLDPSPKDTASILAPIASVIAEIPPHRLTAPSIQALAGRASSRASSRGSPDSRRPSTIVLNNATIFMRALESGFTVLTGNVSEMDLIAQIVPAGQVLFYGRES